MNEIIRITLDSNCIINLFDPTSKTATSVEFLSEIVRHGLSGKADIAITVRVESDLENDIKDTRRKEMMQKLRMFPVVGTMTREKSAEYFDVLQKIIFPGGLDANSRNYINKKNDIDHLVGHLINERDVFVTDDSGILKKKNALKASPGILVHSPEDCLNYLIEIERRNVKHSLQSRNKNVGYYSPGLVGSATFDYSNNNGSFVIGDGYFLFETKWSKASDTSIYAYTDAPSIGGLALAKSAQDIKDISDVNVFDYSSRVRKVNKGGVVIFRNNNNIFAAIKVVDIKDDSRADGKDELTFEYLIQTNGTFSFSGIKDSEVK